MKKEGFTLIELLAVIAVMSFLILVVVPNVIEIYNKASIKAIQSEESTILDAARIFEQDYCLSPIDNTYICPDTYRTSKYICLSDLKTSELITKDINFKGETCKGVILFKDDTNNRTVDKTYLACGTESEGYYTDSSTYNGVNFNCN